MDKTLQERIEAAVRERISVVPYDSAWPGMFDEEARFLRERLPADLLGRIEHFGSTAVPGLAAKPVVDVLVEVTSLEETKRRIVPVLEGEGYDYFWRPEMFEDPPFYAWFIKRDASGARTHHIHMVEADSRLWDRLYFRDYLRAFPDEAQRYGELKWSLFREFPNDRVAYTKGKGTFVVAVTARAKRHYGAGDAHGL